MLFVEDANGEVEIRSVASSNDKFSEIRFIQFDVI